MLYSQTWKAGTSFSKSDQMRMDIRDFYGAPLEGPVYTSTPCAAIPSSIILGPESVMNRFADLTLGAEGLGLSAYRQSLPVGLSKSFANMAIDTEAFNLHAEAVQSPVNRSNLCKRNKKRNKRKQPYSRPNSAAQFNCKSLSNKRTAKGKYNLNDLSAHTHQTDSDILITPETCPLCLMGAPLEETPRRARAKRNRGSSRKPYRFQTLPVIEEEVRRSSQTEGLVACHACKDFPCVCPQPSISEILPHTADGDMDWHHDASMADVQESLAMDTTYEAPPICPVSIEDQEYVTYPMDIDVQDCNQPATCYHCGWCCQPIDASLPLGDLSQLVVVDHLNALIYHAHCFATFWMSHEELTSPNMLQILQTKVYACNARLYQIMNTGNGSLFWSAVL